jgi:hypothetical protein
VKEEEEEVEVKIWNYEGKDYLLSSNNTVYNKETEEVVGMWDGNKIVEMELEEEEEVDL